MSLGIPLEAQNLAGILARIALARKGAIAPAPFTRLIAVTKTHGPERIRALLEAGHRVFGENRVQEAQGKWPALRSEFRDIELHLIGPLQTNKVRDAAQLFDVIHTLDRPRLADALRAAERKPDLLIQVNTGEEPQKAGIAPMETASLVAAAKGLPVKGLMCIPPADVAPAPHFALLAKLARAGGLDWLSMGMSADFETAIRFGATHVRVGSALFGER
jgi:pyridoxal phosphate enzyme (YggS family)